MAGSVIYIAGPYRADTFNGIWDNIREAEKVAIKIWQSGDYALCPHLNTQLFDDVAAPEVFLAGGLELLRRCDKVYMMKKWRQSEGAIKEHDLAIELGLELVYEVEFDN